MLTRSLRTLLFLAACTSMLRPPQLSAQGDLPILLPSDLVRVTTHEKGRYVGAVLASLPDSLTISGRLAAHEFAKSEIRRVDLGRGPTPWRKAEIGGLIGLAGGLVGGLVWVAGFPNENDPLGLGALVEPMLVAISAGGGYATGAMVGLGVGLISPSERWVRVYPPRSRLDIIMGYERQPGVGVRITF